MTLLAGIALLCALLPALLFFRNLPLYRVAPHPAPGATLQQLSVLIPARDEEANIGAAVASVLANRGAHFEVVVLDDHSSDRTAEIVSDLASRDPRVRLAHAPELPVGWRGKVHACHELARHARNELLVFIDADVRLEPDALARFAAFMEESGADFASGVPRQITGTWLEKLLIPLIHFVLLGFLPFDRMRRSTDPAFASAIGQLIIARRSSYDRAGGHAAIRTRTHDGLALARAFRAAGLRADLFDATDTATCRMYHRAAEVWTGLAKNATEAMASPRLIVPCSALLLLGQVVPLVLLASAPLSVSAIGLCGAAVVASLAVRITAARRFRQSWLGAALHALGILLLVAIQWHAWAAWILGRPATWKGRAIEPIPAQ